MKYFISMVMLFSLVSIADASLIGRLDTGSGYQAYYDTEADITWLQDANYADTTNFAINGYMSWSEANAWAAGLNIGGIMDWRLPTSDTCIGYNCTNSEMGNMFYNVLGGIAGEPLSVTHNANYDLFSNITSNYYWTATQANPTQAWSFFFRLGNQGPNNFSSSLSAWAVRDGDILPAPIPAAVLLFGTGLIALVALTRRKSH
jgi:hypothetical protein